MSAPTLEVVEPGFLSTIQDLGRKGYFAAGIPPSGAFDRFALRLGNLLVGNPPGEAGIEMTLMGGRFRILRDVVLAVTGADMGATQDGAPMLRWEAVPVRAGTELAFGVASPLHAQAESRRTATAGTNITRRRSISPPFRIPRTNADSHHPNRQSEGLRGPAGAAEERQVPALPEAQV